MISGEMHMPNRTIYVSEADLPLFERAQQLGGNLSATIAQALRRYLEAQERKTAGFEEVRVKVGKIAYVQKRFMGRLLAKGRVEGPHHERSEIYEIYQTMKGNIALYTRNVPNWYYTGGKKDYDEYDWSNQRGEYALEVFPSLEALQERIPEELYQAAAQALSGEPSELLDI